MLNKIRNELRAFVGQTAFEQLAREWVRQQRDDLPFAPRIIGSHWSRKVQVDVVGVNWEKRAILIGECKWGASEIGRGLVRELIEQRTPKLMAEMPDGGKGWQVQHVYFARSGFSETAQAYSAENNILLVDLSMMEVGLK